jgi:hypothetical protein
MTVHFELEVFVVELGPACTGEQHLGRHSTSPGTCMGLQDEQHMTVDRWSLDELLQACSCCGRLGVPELGAPRAPEDNDSNAAAKAASALMRTMPTIRILHTTSYN